MKTLTLYVRPGCHLCEEAEASLRALQPSFSFQLQLVDITTDHALLLRHRFDVPVGMLEGQTLFIHRVDRIRLEHALSAA